MSTGDVNWPGPDISGNSCYIYYEACFSSCRTQPYNVEIKKLRSERTGYASDGVRGYFYDPPVKRSSRAILYSQCHHERSIAFSSLRLLYCCSTAAVEEFPTALLSLPSAEHVLRCHCCLLREQPLLCCYALTNKSGTWYACVRSTHMHGAN